MKIGRADCADGPGFRVRAAAVDVVGVYYLTHRRAVALRYRVVTNGHYWMLVTAHLLCRA